MKDFFFSVIKFVARDLTILNITCWKGTLVHDLSMPMGVMQKLNGIDRQKKWGWTAQTSLKVGIKKTYQYFLESLR